MKKVWRHHNIMQTVSRLCLHDHSSLSQQWLGLNTICEPITLFRISIPFVRLSPGLDTIINFIKWLPSCEKKRNWTECQGKLVAHFHNFIAKVLCFISSRHIILSRASNEGSRITEKAPHSDRIATQNWTILVEGT